MLSFLQKIFLTFLLLCGQHITAQIKFSAAASPAQIGKNEYTQLRFRVEGEVEIEKFSPPRLEQFIILNGPNHENSISIVNGDVKKTTGISFVIQPKKTGNLTIPAATVLIAGKEYKSNPVVVKVSNGSSGNNQPATGINISPFSNIDPFAEIMSEQPNQDYALRKGENPMEKVKKNMFLKVETDKTTCFVGEPVVATYKLYTRLQSESNMIKRPSFNGFSVVDLQQPDNTTYKRETLNGKEYNVYIICKTQLYPLQSGNLELESAEIENNVQFIREEYLPRQHDALSAFFSGSAIPAEGIVNQKVNLKNEPLSIVVKPLPEANKPVSFKGAVGAFSIEATLTKQVFTTDDVGKLTVVVSGSGNLQLITSPQINWPDNVEAFEAVIKDDLYKLSVPVSGKKIIELPFTVTQPGTYTILPVVFSFFDVAQKKYRTIQTQPLSFSVTKGTGVRQANTGITKNNSSFLQKLFNKRWRVASCIAALIIIGLIVWLKKDIGKSTRKEQNKLAEENNTIAESPVVEIMQNQQNPLALAEESLLQNDSRSFYACMNKAVKEYLSYKFSILPELLNKKTISEELDKKAISNETSLQLHELMDEIEWNLYTPSAASGKMQDIYKRANELIQLLNTYKT